MAGIDARTGKTLGAAMLALLPLVSLAGCGPSRDQLLSEKVAAAQAAADRAVRAAEAAERAAAATGAKIEPTTFADDEVVIEEDGDADEHEGGATETAETAIASPPPAPVETPAG